MFNSLGEAKLEDFKKHNPETVRQLCDQSEARAQKNRKLIKDINYWKLQAGIGWVLFIGVLIMGCLNSK